jgi:hypothetical protein
LNGKKEKRMRKQRNKYAALDDAICRHIAEGRPDHPTESKALEAIARSLLITSRTPFRSAWRMIEKRMKVMRKAGRLVYERRGIRQGQWRVVE